MLTISSNLREIPLDSLNLSQIQPNQGKYTRLALIFINLTELYILALVLLKLLDI